ncbi:MAG: bifunctional adenosylcobinamide kinase/adenosylcobinamide-phosphate guanylyltransferase [Acidobacteria bacterium]|jgi:adenosylcobinamide kinase/adenosylcobinamide-phosphate guanylyltransferase|nr:bifunctional adenosylcobinamide kinase/adenosylcobinamide-phosphate guanylyltransferase [Acidobacteriota bacterium]
MLTLVIGGARSGKSRYAQSLCAKESQVAYIATSRLEDDEMRARVARHRRDRPVSWLTIEEPLAISDAVRLHAPAVDFILLDCLTVWLSNFCGEHRHCSAEELELAASDEVARLISASTTSNVIVVSNEVGWGIVPDCAVGRLFRDLQGLVNQQVACGADFVYQTVVGIPLLIKPGRGCA